MNNIIAQKNNNIVITLSMWVLLVLIFIGNSYANNRLGYADVIFGIPGLIALVLLIKHLFTPSILISSNENIITIHGFTKNIDIDSLAISTINIKHKRSKGVRYQHGNLEIYLKDGEKYQVKHISYIDKVKSEIINIIDNYKK